MTATLGNVCHVRYDLCLEKGYPIGSGVIEGACRNLINDRLEPTGMRWTFSGVESIIRLRAVYINSDWKDFPRFHRESETTRLYGISHKETIRAPGMLCTFVDMTPLPPLIDPDGRSEQLLSIEGRTPSLPCSPDQANTSPFYEQGVRSIYGIPSLTQEISCLQFGYAVTFNRYSMRMRLK